LTERSRAVTIRRYIVYYRSEGWMQSLRSCATVTLFVGIVIAVLGVSRVGKAETTPTEVRLALSMDGHIGAWLVAGPFDRPHALDEETAAPRLDEPAGTGPNGPRWRLASSNDDAIDIGGTIDSRFYVAAYAAGVLHLERGGRHLLLLGVGDAVSVTVDGKRVFSRESPRPEQDDQDLVALDLAAGDHSVLLALHRYGLARTLRARVLDDQLQPPAGSSWVLPGTSEGDARTLAARMSSLTLDRGMMATGYQASLTVRFPGGAPRGVALDVRARLVKAPAPDGPSTPLFEVVAGEVPVDNRSVRELQVRLPRVAGDEVEDGDWTVHVEVAGRPVDLPFHPRRSVRTAAARADRAIHDAQGLPLSTGALDSVAHIRERLVDFVGKGDGDLAAQEDDARELNALSEALEAQRDPYVGSPWRKGAMRRAYRSPVDGQLSEFAVYVPPNFDPGRTYPLIVALHGMNGRPLEMVMWLFGFDDPDRDGNWEDRHPRRELPPLEAIVVAPDGHFNAMYRDMGEDDVMRVIDWAMSTYPVDASRVTITGPSMGGIGSAACALHYPARFAAAEPLCGYHSLFIRNDFGRPLHPWEKFIAEQRSNVFWAENGQYLPLYVVHGTKDLPEENSGVLIDRYTDLNYDVTHEHPELGHNVWQTTYEDLKGAKWLLTHRRPMHPRALRFKTPSTRWADDAWLHVRELASSDTWGEVIARIDGKNVIMASSHGVSALGLDRDTDRIDDAAPVTVGIDGRKITFQAGEPIELHKEAAEWRAGAAVHDGPFKHGTVTGPIHDVFHDPVLFVWGASDPAQARANEEAAQAWARVRWGVRVDYPILSDTDFYARGEPLANDRALFLVGNAKSNRVVRELEPSFPIRIEGDAVVLGDRRLATKDGRADRSQLGAMFIRPNPRRPDRYVVVVEGVGAFGTWRSLSLPDMLPDFVVFDEDVAPASGQLLLAGGKLRAGGFFGADWSVPSETDANAVARVIPAGTTN
jgi:predicted esterase